MRYCSTSSAWNDRLTGSFLPARQRPGVSATPYVRSVRTGCFYLLLPAAVISLAAACSREGTDPLAEDRSPVGTQIYITKAGFPSIRTLDLFFFVDDTMRPLVSYQHFDHPDSRVFRSGSLTGPEILVAVANYGDGPSSWTDVTSYASLSSRLSYLDLEDADYPVMSGEIHITAEASNRLVLPISQLFSIVSFESIRCDFQGKPYSGATLEDVRVFLTNVRREYGVLDTLAAGGASWLNLGGLSDGDMASLKCPGLVCSAIPGSIGEDVVHPGIELKCYPNASERETMGSPYTRLVIEGTLRGRKYYYPIDINRSGPDSGGEGLRRNVRYAVNVVITRTGTDAPDIPVTSDVVSSIVKVMPWEDCDGVVETF